MSVSIEKRDPVMMFTTMYASPTLISMLSFNTFTTVRMNISVTYNWFFLSDENAVANSEVFDEIVIGVQVELYLEVASAVLLSSLRVFVWNDEVVNNSFL